MKTNESQLQRSVSGACLIVAPLLLLTHLTDLSLLIADGWIGWKILTRKSFWEQDAALSEIRPT